MHPFIFTIYPSCLTCSCKDYASLLTLEFLVMNFGWLLILDGCESTDSETLVIGLVYLVSLVFLCLVFAKGLAKLKYGGVDRTLKCDIFIY